MSLAMTLKRLIRPLVPDRFMARYRLAQHSRQVRTNVDVVLSDSAKRRRWLGTTPDTYRVLDVVSPNGAPTPIQGIAAFGSDIGHAIELLDVVDAEIGVVARVATPSIVDRKRVEPAMEPIAIAGHQDVIDEVGGLPGGDDSLAGLLARLRDAGRRFALLPVETNQVDSARHDPIDAIPVVILSAVPLHDIGGGSRAAQLAFALLRSGFHVTYVAMHGTQESVDLGLRYIHPNLEQYRVDGFDAAGTAHRASESGFVLVEVPAGAYRGSIEILGKRGWIVGYDIIDDWSDPALGGEWFNVETERWMLDRVDFVTASALDLVGRARVAGVSATLIPNAVNRDVFGPVIDSSPHDLPVVDGPLIGYHGSLYGDWFDWNALRSVADANPDGAIVVIGDTKGVAEEVPGNVVFLGLKAQQDLPAYVQRFDVGLLPFHVTETTHAVSPLKIYEYLASGVPVAAPPLRALDGLDDVYVSDDLVAAVRAALEASNPDRTEALNQHSWETRVEALLQTAGIDLPAIPGKSVITVRRPVVHYAQSERDVRLSGDVLERE